MGHFEYTVMPFSLSNASHYFNFSMNILRYLIHQLNILRDLIHQYMIIYLDDILIYSRDSSLYIPLMCGPSWSCYGNNMCSIAPCLPWILYTP